MTLFGKIRSRPSRVFIALLLSYITVLLIPIGIGSVAYIRTGRAIAEDISNHNLTLLRQIQLALDRGLLEIRRMCWQVSCNSRIKNFMEVELPLKSRDRLELAYLVKELRAFGSDNFLLHDFYLYFRNSDRIVTPDASYEPALFFKYLKSYKDLSEKQWHSYLMDFDRYFTLKPSCVIQGIGYRSEVLSYIQSIPMNNLFESPAVLVALIDSQVIRKMLSDIVQGAYGCILDDKGEILIETGINPGTVPLSEMQGFEQEGILYKKREVVAFTGSSNSGMRFVSIIPKEIFLSKLNDIRNLVYWIVGICFVVGLVAAYILAYRSYRPIRLMVDTLASGFGRKPLRNRNELEFIRDTVMESFRKNRQLESEYEDIIRENRRFREQINRNSTLVKNGLLRRLITGRTDNVESALDWLSRYKVVLPYHNHQVILFHIDDCTRFLRENNEKEWNLVKFIIASLTEQLTGTHHQGYVCELDYDLLALLFNFPDNASVADGVSGICARIQRFMNTHYGAEITVGIGNPVTDIHELRGSYLQALAAMDYRIIREKSSVIRYNEITDRVKDYYYPITAELSIINSVRDGNIVRCEKLLDEIYEHNFQKSNLPVKLIRCLIFDMIGTAVKVLDQIRINYVDVFGSDFEPVEELIDTENVHEIYKKIKWIYRQTCQYLNSRKKSHKIQLKEKILTYIQNHFSEMNLSQTLIAEELGITAPYLSSFFKHEIGENMVDYVNKLRLEQAKHLLVEGKMSLAEIARAVGCGSDKTLIRLFNRFEGITPGRFRESRSAEMVFRRNA